jgi:hypothetical protein
MPQPEFRTGFPRAEFERQKNFGRCPSCVHGRHAQCERHINDGAFDADDFVRVSCICPCEGDVHAPYSLIDLVAELRREIAEIAVLLNDERGARAAAEERLITLAEFAFDELDDALIDEEGHLDPMPGARGVFEQFKGIFLDSEIASLQQLFDSDDERFAR